MNFKKSDPERARKWAKAGRIFCVFCVTFAWLLPKVAHTQEMILLAPSARGAKVNPKQAPAAEHSEKLGQARRSGAAKFSVTRPAIAEVEPNNGQATAQVLTGNSPIEVNGNAETVDAGQIVINYQGGVTDDIEDLFKLTLTQPGLKISLSGVQSDLDIFLFDSPITRIIDGSNATGVGNEEINQPSLPAGTYIIGVTIFDPDPIGSPSTPYVLTLTFNEGQAQPPANDECATATTVGPLPYTDNLNTTLATVGANDPVLSCADGGGGKTVWYTFTPAQNVYVKVSTVGSSPDDYDTALGIFTGTCGALTEIRCNDDAATGDTRHAELSFAAAAGQAYIIHVAEWNGGGPNGGVPTGGNLVFSVSETEPPTLFQGPGTASIPNGASVSTNDFTSGARATVQALISTKQQAIRIGEVDLIKNTKHGLPHVRSPRANFVKDTAIDNAAEGLLSPKTRYQPDAPFPLKGFPGIADKGTFIPPDPIMAAGPNHLMACVNSDFGIFTKDGTLVKQIDATLWFENVLPGLGEAFGVAFDPQIAYDHHANRWVMLYIASDFSTEAYYLISTSDDSDPTGTWCNFAIPAHLNGATPIESFGDYPKMAIDANAIYVTANRFGFNSGFAYVKLYIFAKTQFYNNSCGAIAWTDFWNLRDPDNLENTVFTVVPALTFGTAGTEYLINDSPYEVGTFMTLWSLTNPLSPTPTLTAVNVPVDTSFGEPSDAQQLGGGDTPIDVGGRRVRNAVYRNGSLWTAHSVPGGTDNAFTLARYLRINTATATATEDVAFGADNFWYFYPAVMADQNSNLTMVVNRSGLTEFAGIRYTGRLTSEAPGLQPSAQLKAGESNYVKTFDGSRNRWGDYNGIALDPSNNNTIWMFAEYAESPVGSDPNDQRWGTWFGQTTFVPLSGSQISLDPEEIYFGEVGLDSTSASIPISIRSIGNQSLTVTAISNPGSNFALENLPPLPSVVAPGGSVEFAARFAPTAVTPTTATVTVTSNDAETPTVQIALIGQVAPEIDLSVTTLTATLQTGDVADQNFTISNLGGTDLAYQVVASGVGALSLPPGTASKPDSEERQFALAGDPQQTNIGEMNNSLAVSEMSGQWLVGSGQKKSAVSGHSPLATVVQGIEVIPQNRKDRGVFGDLAPDAIYAWPNETDAPFAASANTIFTYDVSTAAGERFALGVEFDGTNFWVTGAGATAQTDPNRLFKYDIRGNLLATFAQPTTSGFGWRDLAFDGTFLYASDSQNIDQINPATGTATGVTIPGPLDSNRALAYDPATDHFWTANFDSKIFEIDRNGNVINSYANTLAIYGLAWDATTAGGPYLWAWSQDGNGTLASRFTPATGTFSVVSFEGDDAIGGVAGGVTFTTALPTTPAGIGVLVALHQSTPDMIVGYLTPPSWITNINPASGTIAPQSSELVSVMLDAVGLAPGSYEADLIVGNSDVDEGRLQIPLTLTVTAPQGRQIRVQPLAKDFGAIEVGSSSASTTFRIRSIGAENLTVTGIASSNPAFAPGNLPTLPLVLPPGNIVDFTANFSPTAAGPDSSAMTITSDDADDPSFAVLLTGYGVPVGAAEPGILYASSGKNDGGRFFNIDPTTGAATLIGATGFPAVSGLAINSLEEIYGSTPTQPSTLIKINAVTGVGTPIGVMNIDFVDALAFDANDVLYGVSTESNSSLYIINTSTAQATLIDTTGVDFISGLSFSPSGVLYGSTGQGGGIAPGDQIYTINTTTAVATLVGTTGFNASITDIAFNKAGKLFGMTGSQGTNPSSFISINPSTGAGTLIGALGFNSMSGLCFAPGDPSAVAPGDQTMALPKTFTLEQNYPNPFNPSTKIRYAIARDGHVVLKIYTLLGQEIRTLVDQKQSANFYEVRWDGRNNAGFPMPSGIYFYQIRADGHVETRRMAYLK